MTHLPADYWLREYDYWIKRYVESRERFGADHEFTIADHAMAFRALGKYDVLRVVPDGGILQ